MSSVYQKIFFQSFGIRIVWEEKKKEIHLFFRRALSKTDINYIEKFSVLCIYHKVFAREQKPSMLYDAVTVP